MKPMSDISPATKWLVLALTSLALFGNYYVYDSIAPIADLLQRQLGFSDTQLATLNAIYSAPNIVMVLIGGVLVDRFGASRVTLWSTAVCVLGAVLTAASSKFEVMAAGRLLFGMGAETMIVAITASIGLWFLGSTVALAMGINISLARAGSYAADLSPNIAGPLYAQGWQPPLWLAAAIMVTSLVAAVAFRLIDARARRNDAPRPTTATDRFVWSDVWRFDRSYWYVVALCVLFYSVIFPFRSTFSIKYFQHAHGLSLEAASLMNSWVFFAAIFATPLFGLIADRFGHRALLMMLGSVLLPLSFVFLLFGGGSLWVTTVLIGISFSLVPAVLWPAVAQLVPKGKLGTAYGTMTMLQNIGMTLANLAAGGLNDFNDASAANPTGYTPMLVFFAVIGALAFVFTWLLRQREQGPSGHGLERPVEA
jgi:MFS family permease